MNVRIASNHERLDLRLPEHPRGNSRATVFLRLCEASASDMGLEAALLNLPASCNHFRVGTPEHAAWHQSWLAKNCELGRMQAVEQQLDDSDRRPEPWWPDGLAIAAALFAAVVFAAGCALAGWWIS